MTYLLFVFGIILLGLVLSDFSVTVFMPKGAGFMTGSITIVIAKLFKLLTGNKGTSKLLEYKHFVIIVVMLVSWVLMIWIGFTCIYSLEVDSIVNSKTHAAASFPEKLYFVGYTLSTLGLGDFVANSIGWQILTSIISFMGLVFITICITYIVPVINNIIEKATLTLRIISLGESVHQILLRGYNGTDFSDLADEFSSLSGAIFKYAKNHAAYPVLHHVHNSNRKENTILKLASLDEVCTILMHHIPEDKCRLGNNIKVLRTSITYYLKSVQEVDMAEEAPPPPNLKRLSGDLRISLRNTSSREIERLYRQLSKRRRIFRKLIEDDGFYWYDISSEGISLGDTIDD